MSGKFSHKFARQLIEIDRPQNTHLVKISVSDPWTKEVRSIEIWQKEIDLIIDQLKIISSENEE